MAGVNLATGFVPIAPSMKGIQGKLTKQLNGPAGVAGQSAGRSMGSRMASATGRVLKTGVVVGAAAAGAVAGATLLGGFKNAVSRQNSKKVFTALYGSAKGATAVMTDLRDVAGKSPIDYSAYLKAGESLAYAGVKGKAATGTLENVGLAITAAGGGSEKLDQAMGGVMKAVNNGGVAMMDSLNMISDSGVPILSGLAAKFGKPIGTIKKMASEGKINITDVMDVMENATGKTFQTMRKGGKAASLSFGNQWLRVKDNVVNAVSDRMIPVLDKMAPIIGDIGDKLEAWIKGVDLSPMVGWFKGIANWAGQLDFSSFDNFIKSLSSGGGSEAFQKITNSVKTLAPAFQKFGSSLKAAGPEIATLGAGAVTVLAGALGFLADHVDTIIRFMPLIVAGFIAWRVAASAIANATLGLRAAEVAMTPVYLANNIMRNNSARLEARVAASKAASTTATAVNTGAENANLLTRARGVATMVAQKTAMVATTVATKAATVAQKAMNLAMRMNPIGLIITGILALVAGLIWFFTQTKIGKTIITAVWSAIKIAIGAVVGWFTNSVVPWFQAAIANIGSFFRSFGVVAATVWNGFKTVLGVVWNWVKTYVFTPIKNFVMVTIPNAFKFLVNAVKLYINMWKTILTAVWNFVKKWVFTPIYNFVFKTIPDAFKFLVNAVKIYINNWKRILNVVWQWVKTYVFNPIKNFVTKTIPDAFQLFVNFVKSRMDNFKNNMRRIWNFVKDHVFSPLRNFIMETIPNAFETGVDLIKEFWNKLKKVASDPVKFVVDTVYNKGLVKMWNPIAGFINKDNWKLKKVDVSKFRGGGKVWGPGTETSDSIPARLSRNEHVLSAKDVKNLGGHGNVYRLRSAAAQGWTPGLATGGTLSDAARWLQAKGARITEFKAWGQNVGGHSHNSQHYTGNAFDANYGPGGTNATEQSFFDRMVPQINKLFPKLHVLWRVADHFNHLHVGTGAGGKVGSGGGGGGGGWVPGLDTLVDWVKGKLGGIGSGRVAEGMSGMTTKLIDGMADKVRSVFDVFGGGGGSTAGASQDVVAAVRGVAKGYGWDKGQQWKSLRWIIDKESSWDPNAANPTSSARGLFQKMTSIHGAVEPTAAGQAKWGLNYIKNRYTNPISAQAFHRGHGYYANGGAVIPDSLSMLSAKMPKPHLFDDGGFLTDRMVAMHGTSKPDAVLTDSQWSDMHKLAVEDGGRGRGDVNLNVYIQGDIDSRATAEKVVNDLSFEVKRLFRGGKYL